MGKQHLAVCIGAYAAGVAVMQRRLNGFVERRIESNVSQAV